MPPSRSSAALVVAALALAGRPAPAAEAPAKEAPPKEASPPEAGDRPAVEATSLADAVGRALARNPSAQVAELEIARFAAVAAQARAGWLPTLYGNASYTRLEGDRRSGAAPNPLLAGQDQGAASLTLTAPLFVARPLTQWRHAKDDIETARWSAAETRRQLALAVGRAWLQLLAQHRVIAISARAEVTARAHLDFTQKQYAGGYGTRLDEVRADQEVQSDRAQVEQARVQLARLREALGVLVGADHPVDAQDAVDLPPPPSYADATTEAVRQRSDVKLQEQRVVAARHQVRDRWADYTPQLVATFTPFLQTQSPLPATVTPTAGYQGVLALTLPLYDGGLRYGQERERGVLSREAEVGLEGVRRQAASDVRAAVEEMERAGAALAAAREAARLAGEGVTLTDLAYRAGASTNIEVIDAERRARDAETAVAVAEDAERQALLDLLVASGRFPARK